MTIGLYSINDASTEAYERLNALLVVVLMFLFNVPSTEEQANAFAGR